MKKESNFLVNFIVALYLIVHFIPDFGGADVMGAQWIYVSVIDFAVLGYIAKNYAKFKEAIAGVFKFKFTIVYFVFLLWALLSYFYAINPTEALVCLARLVSTFLIFINLSILFYKKDTQSLFLSVALLVSLTLLSDSMEVIKGFVAKQGEMSLDSLIISLMGRNGNKNVMAASLLIKFPFAVYYVSKSKIGGQVLAGIALFLGLIALFILNTRSTFVGLILILLIYTLTTLFFKIKAKSTMTSILKQIMFFVVPTVLAFFFANAILDNALKLQDTEGGYGTVTKRLGDISIEKGSDRIHLWSGAVDYALKHPLLGGGYGNWKLASIPYEKEFTNDLFVPYHCHNDFIETFADVGFIGGGLYAFMFLLLLLSTIAVWRNEKLKEYQFIATISFLAITCYVVDAFLNFPTERTSMQTMFALTASLILAPGALYSTTAEASGLNLKINKITKWMAVVFMPLAFVLILPTLFINTQVYRSLKVQKFVMGEIDADPKMALSEVKDAFPSIPNLSTSTLPIPALVARYYYRDKMYDEALALLNASEKINPYLYYTDFIKTAVYASKNNIDSVSFYANRAFYNWPRATSYYKNAIFAASRKKDTAAINKAFTTYVKYRNQPEAWNQYLLGRLELHGPSNALTLQLFDSAIKQFPKDTATFKNLINLLAQSGAQNVVALSTNYGAKGMQAFVKGNYKLAAEYYLKAAAEDQNNYTYYENVGICYYSDKQFEKAISYFNQAIALPTETTGKSEFYKAMCLISMGKKEQACTALQQAKAKGYPGTDQFIASNCK